MTIMPVNLNNLKDVTNGSFEQPSNVVSHSRHVSMYNILTQAIRYQSSHLAGFDRFYNDNKDTPISFSTFKVMYDKAMASKSKKQNHNNHKDLFDDLADKTAHLSQRKYLFGNLGYDFEKHYSIFTERMVRETIDDLVGAEETIGTYYNRDIFNHIDLLKPEAQNLIRKNNSDQNTSDKGPTTPIKLDQPLSLSDIAEISSGPDENPISANQQKYSRHINYQTINACQDLSQHIKYNTKVPFAEVTKLMHLDMSALMNLTDVQNKKLTYKKVNGHTCTSQLFTADNKNPDVASKVGYLVTKTSVFENCETNYDACIPMSNYQNGFNTSHEQRHAYKSLTSFFTKKLLHEYTTQKIYKSSDHKEFDPEIGNRANTLVSYLNLGVPHHNTGTHALTHNAYRKVFNNAKGPSECDIELFKNYLADNDNVLLDAFKSLLTIIPEGQDEYLLYSLYIALVHGDLPNHKQAPHTPIELRNLCRILSQHNNFCPNYIDDLVLSNDKHIHYRAEFRNGIKIDKANRFIEYNGIVFDYVQALEQKDIRILDLDIKGTTKRLPLEFLNIETILVLEHRAKAAACMFVWDLICNIRNGHLDKIPSKWKDAVENTVLIEQPANQKSKLVKNIDFCERKLCGYDNEVVQLGNFDELHNTLKDKDSALSYYNHCTQGKKVTGPLQILQSVIEIILPTAPAPSPLNQPLKASEIEMQYNQLSSNKHRQQMLAELSKSHDSDTTSIPLPLEVNDYNKMKSVIPVLIDK